MIEKEIFEIMEAQYGDVGSWAVWEEVGEKPKSNMGHLNVFDKKNNTSLLSQLNNNVIMVGLNFSRPLLPTEPFKNFHDLNPSANDFKIRYAFKNTKFYGAYMTDIIKNLEMKDSNDVVWLLKSKKEIIEKNIEIFIQELNHLKSKKPIILTFGAETYNILHKNLSAEHYSKLVKLTHYSCQISKENYKVTVMQQLANAGVIEANINDFLFEFSVQIKDKTAQLKTIQNSSCHKIEVETAIEFVRSCRILLAKAEKTAIELGVDHTRIN